MTETDETVSSGKALSSMATAAVPVARIPRRRRQTMSHMLQEEHQHQGLPQVAVFRRNETVDSVESFGIDDLCLDDDDGNGMYGIYHLDTSHEKANPGLIITIPRARNNFNGNVSGITMASMGYDDSTSASYDFHEGILNKYPLTKQQPHRRSSLTMMPPLQYHQLQSNNNRMVQTDLPISQPYRKASMAHSNCSTISDHSSCAYVSRVPALRRRVSIDVDTPIAKPNRKASMAHSTVSDHSSCLVSAITMASTTTDEFSSFPFFSEGQHSSCRNASYTDNHSNTDFGFHLPVTKKHHYIIKRHSLTCTNLLPEVTTSTPLELPCSHPLPSDEHVRDNINASYCQQIILPRKPMRKTSISLMADLTETSNDEVDPKDIMAPTKKANNNNALQLQIPVRKASISNSSCIDNHSLKSSSSSSCLLGNNKGRGARRMPSMESKHRSHSNNPIRKPIRQASMSSIIDQLSTQSSSSAVDINSNKAHVVLRKGRRPTTCGQQLSMRTTTRNDNRGGGRANHSLPLSSRNGALLATNDSRTATSIRRKPILRHTSMSSIDDDHSHHSSSPSVAHTKNLDLETNIIMFIPRQQQRRRLTMASCASSRQSSLSSIDCNDSFNNLSSTEFVDGNNPTFNNTATTKAALATQHQQQNEAIILLRRAASMSSLMDKNGEDAEKAGFFNTLDIFENAPVKPQRKSSMLL